ncbi:MAG: hypothetical protein ILO34_07780 [Kiritimatiellae bacterium]|nr:hypothetical protein [Kiritimatiellia bacterium]
MKQMIKIGAVALAAAFVPAILPAGDVEVENAAALETEAEEADDGMAVGWTPLAIGVFSPVQLPWGMAKWDVFGLDLNLLYSDAPKMYGLGIGGLAFTSRDYAKGLIVSALCNWGSRNVYGMRATLGANVCRDTVYGFEAGCFGYRKDFWGIDVNFLGSLQKNVTGWQIGGLVNMVDNQSYGLETALGINMSGIAYGCQLGGGNFTDELHGAQIGFLNYAKECPWGFQIGIINIIMDNTLKVLPIVNGYF